MSKPKTRFIRVKYEGIIELEAEVDAIPGRLQLTHATHILVNGINAVMLGNEVVRVGPVKYQVGLEFPKEKPRRKR